MSLASFSNSLSFFNETAVNSASNARAFWTSLVDGSPPQPTSVSIRGYPVTFPCNSRYLNGTGFLDKSGFKSLSMR